MSKEEKICLLSEYKIDEKDKEMKSTLDEVNKLEKENQYYIAVYILENVILQDGTTEKYNYRFLKLILDHYDKIFEEIKNYSKGITLDENFYKKYENAINDVNKYNFYYFRDCFDKFEVSLNQNQLEDIRKKKLKHNLKVIEKYPFLKEEYLNLIKDIESEDKIVSAQTIFDTINNLNLRILDENESKLFNIYKYLDINLIKDNKIFDYIQKNAFFLNQFSFGFLDKLGIPIGFSDNLNLKLRYLFLIIKNKINELDEEKKRSKQKNRKKEKKGSAIEFVFKTFKEIFSSIKEQQFEFLKYFALLFVYVIFEGDYNVEKVYNEELLLKYSYFKILCEQFSTNNIVDDYNKIDFNKMKIKEQTDNEIIIYFNNEELTMNLKEYSINSFLINTAKNCENIILKNNSKKFLCKDKIYDDYFDDFIELLKKISCLNTVGILQYLNNEFKLTKAFFSNEDIKKDFFDNRLKFYPFKCENIFGITDKYLLEVYLSSIYLNNIKKYDMDFDNNFKEILFIFNMAINSVAFQHEALNHYVRAYLSYSGKVSIDTKSSNIYPIQKLEEIKEIPKYIRKFKEKLEERDLFELSNPSNLEYKQYIGDYPEEQNELKDKQKNDNQLNDEGYYYERQLFTTKDEKKLTIINFLQALMLLDEDAYNLDPVHFHYCFLELSDPKNYSFIKENFRGNLLLKILGKIDIDLAEKIKSLTFIVKRTPEEPGVLFYDWSDRIGYDVMSSYAY